MSLWLRRLLRRLAGVQVTLTHDAALERVRAFATARGIDWLDPIEVREELRFMRILVGPQHYDAGTEFEIDLETGQIEYLGP